MKLSAINISAYFISFANEMDENDLTNLKLQKLLYFAQGKFLAQTKSELFSDEIEAWKLGPVVKEVYSSLRKCGSFPVTVFDLPKDFKIRRISEQKKAFLRNIWEDYGLKYSAYYLVQLTHATKTPWAIYYKKDQNIVIPKKALKEYFIKHE